MEPFTKIPNIFIENMGRYRGATVKIYLAIFRYTMGWQKVKDKISYGQIKKMTGLSQRHIKENIAPLIRDGWMMTTGGEKAGYTYHITIDIKSIDQKSIELETLSPQIPPNLETKGLPQKKEEKKERNKIGASPQKPAAAAKTTDKRLKPLTVYFWSLYHDKMGNGQKPAWTGKEAKLLQQDIQRVGDPVRLKIAMRGFFSDEIPGVKEFVEENTGYTYASFHGVLEKILNEMRRIDERKRR